MPTDSETNSRGRRQCHVPGCTKTIKSQGVCQKHGAKTKMCKVHNCTKGSQGGCEGMCKAHYKESKNQGAGGNVSSDSGNVGSNGSNGSSVGSNGGGAVDEPPAVPSVYEKVLPETICHPKAFGDLFPYGCDTQSGLEMTAKTLKNKFPGGVVSTMTIELPFPCIFADKDIIGHEPVVVAKYNEGDNAKAAVVLHVDLIQENPKYPARVSSAAADEDEFDVE